MKHDYVAVYSLLPSLGYYTLVVVLVGVNGIVCFLSFFLTKCHFAMLVVLVVSRPFLYPLFPVFLSFVVGIVFPFWCFLMGRIFYRVFFLSSSRNIFTFAPLCWHYYNISSK